MLELLAACAIRGRRALLILFILEKIPYDKRQQSESMCGANISLSENFRILAGFRVWALWLGGVRFQGLGLQLWMSKKGTSTWQLSCKHGLVLPLFVSSGCKQQEPGGKFGMSGARESKTVGRSCACVGF